MLSTQKLRQNSNVLGQSHDQFFGQACRMINVSDLPMLSLDKFTDQTLSVTPSKTQVFDSLV